MSLWVITGINIGLALANVMIALLNLRILRAHQQYLNQIDFYKRNTPDFPSQTGGSSRIRVCFTRP